MKKRQFISLLLAALMLLGCCACGKIKVHSDETAPSRETQTDTQTDTQTPTESGSINPLTGESESYDLSRERPFAVMVNNISVAQPQVGISKADWIYEIEAEGGITRMMALFTHIQDVPSIGSIRSMRPYFLSTAMAYDAIMLHAGGSPDSYVDCEAYHWDHLDAVRDAAVNSAIFYRDPSRSTYGTEHSLFLYGDRVSSFADQYGLRRIHNDGYQTGLSFSADAASLCTGDAVNVEVRLSASKTTSFAYHPDTGKYIGFQYGGDYNDGADGSPVLFSNLLVLQTQITPYNDQYGHIAVAVVGSGTGYFFTGGKCLPINWSRDSVDSPFRYTAQDGTPISFTPGKTYCAIISAEQNGVTYY